MQVAQTILQQLGGNRFIAMTGARDFVGLANGLQFSLPQRLCTNKANKARVILAADDTYTLEFFSIRGVNVKAISEHAMVYADNLAALFTEQTGLAVRL